ncbi:MAG TPA: hypothetical protein VFA11_04670 [Acidimicrobiales bacterium]|nr:hypothetical protein [Acidimicrobiales bacterium]
MNLTLRRSPASAVVVAGGDGTSPPPPVTSGQTVEARERRLVRTLDSARGRLRLAGDSTLVAAGGALVVAGVFAVLAGWAGASHTTLVAGQIPYLISGGLLGLGMIFLGGFLYFAYWMAVVARNSARREEEARAETNKLLAAVEETNRHLMALLERSAGPARARSGTIDLSAPAGLVATANGSMFHRPDCPAVAGRPNLRAVDPTAEPDLSPCGICDPLEERAGDS